MVQTRFDLGRGAATLRPVLAVLAFALAALLTPGLAAARLDDGTATERAKAVLAQIQAGKLDRSLLAPALNAELTDAILGAMTDETRALGSPLRFGLRYAAANQGVTTYVFRVRWTNDVLDYTLGFVDATDEIRVLYFRPGPPQ